MPVTLLMTDQHISLENVTYSFQRFNKLAIFLVHYDGDMIKSYVAPRFKCSLY